MSNKRNSYVRRNRPPRLHISYQYDGSPNPEADAVRSEEDRSLVRDLQYRYGLTDRAAYDFSNFFFDIKKQLDQEGVDTKNPRAIDLISISSIQEMRRHNIDVSRNDNIEQRFLESFDLEGIQLRNADEGVTKKGSHHVSEESKLDKARLAPVFEGSLDREAMARALAAVMDQRGLSVRKAGDASGTSAGIISSIKDQRASLDKAVEVLDELGFEIDFVVRPKDHS